MKRQRKWAAVLATVVLLLSQVLPVMAAGTPADLSLQLAGYQESSRQVTVSCVQKDGGQVTNGKIRILYDTGELKLLSDEAGKVLQKGLCEINDCLTGNKEEGELVAAFASSGPLPGEGELLNLTFQLDESVKDGQELQVELKVEKLAGDDGEIGKKEQSLTFRAGENGGNHSSTTQKGVKTGDGTQILPYILLTGCALATLILVSVMRNRQKRKQ